MKNRCYLRGTTLMGLFNTVTGCIFNRVLVAQVDVKTEKVERRFWMKATAFDEACEVGESIKEATHDK